MEQYLRRSIFDIVYQPTGKRNRDWCPNTLAPRSAPLTSFTWGCSSDSKKSRSQFLTHA